MVEVDTGQKTQARGNAWYTGPNCDLEFHEHHGRPILALDINKKGT